MEDREEMTIEDLRVGQAFILSDPGEKPYKITLTNIEDGYLFFNKENGEEVLRKTVKEFLDLINNNPYTCGKCGWDFRAPGSSLIVQCPKCGSSLLGI